MLQIFETTVTFDERFVRNVLQKGQVVRNGNVANLEWAPLRQRTRQAWELIDPGVHCSLDSACRPPKPAGYMATTLGGEHAVWIFPSASPPPLFALGANPSPKALQNHLYHTILCEVYNFLNAAMTRRWRSRHGTTAQPQEIRRETRA
jgi:hypothetical protein